MGRYAPSVPVCLVDDLGDVYDVYTRLGSMVLTGRGSVNGKIRVRLEVPSTLVKETLYLYVILVV